MNINMAASSTASTSSSLNINASSVKGLNTSNSALSSSTSSTSELTEEEKLYDADNDGELSSTEKAAMLEAQANQKALESVKHKSSSDSEAASVDISQEGLKLQKQKPPEQPKDVNEMSDDELKDMLSKMKDSSKGLPKELGEYAATDVSDLSEDDLNEIRQIMSDMQNKMKEKMAPPEQNNEQRLMNKAISEYKKFSPENILSTAV